MGASLAMPSKTVGRARAGAVKVEARMDAGVGVFGNKAGMTQLFMDDGLCVPVTVIAVQAGNVVTQVCYCSRARANARESARFRVSRARGARAAVRGIVDVAVKGFRAKAPPSARYPLFLSPRTDASSPPRTPSSRCQVKTEGTDGYNAVQVGYDQVADYKITKPEVGHCAKAGVPPMRHLEEFRLKEASDHAPGQQLKPSEMFKEGDVVDVRGTSIGKGWQGAVKKYGFSRGLMTHGSKSHRQHGSVGAGTSPGRIFPGKKMHSQMGNETVTARKLKVMRVEDDCIIVKGSVPGKRGNLLRVAPAKIVGKTC